MKSPGTWPRSGISAEARAWLAANPPMDRAPINLDNAAEIRATIRSGWEPSMAAARAEFAPNEREIEVGGVPSLEITGDTPTGTIVYFFGGGTQSAHPRRTSSSQHRWRSTVAHR